MIAVADRDIVHIFLGGFEVSEMETSDNILAKARRQAELNCDFVFPKMKGYREITEDQLPEGTFSPDELKQLKRLHRKQRIVLALLLYGAFVTLFTILIPIALIIIFVVLLRMYKREKQHEVSDNIESMQGLMRGVVLHRTTVNCYFDKGTREYIFYSIFFPENHTFIKFLYQPSGRYQSYFEVGDRVAVYRVAGEAHSKIISTKDLVLRIGVVESAMDAYRPKEHKPVTIDNERWVIANSTHEVLTNFQIWAAKKHRFYVTVVICALLAFASLYTIIGIISLIALQVSKFA